MLYVVYQTNNKINGKIYIGVHAAENPEEDDGYRGSNVPLKRAIRKYGRENFIREILFTYDTEEEAYAKEAEIVTLEFAARRDIYNIQTGGSGGNLHSEETKQKMRKPKSEEHKQNMSKAKLGPKHPLWHKHPSEETRQKMRLAQQNMSEETKRIKSMKLSKASCGSNNPFALSPKVIKQRRKDVKEIVQIWGWKAELSRKWCLSNAGTRYFINKHALDLVKKERKR